MCEYYVSHGLCNDFPDWAIAETSLKIGYDYGWLVTGELAIDKQELDLLDEDKLSDDVLDP